MSKGKSIGFCKTCKSEMVELVNDSIFRDGECEACEYRRYRTQPALIEALDEILAETVDLDLAVGNELTEDETAARDKALRAIEDACG